VFVCVCPRAPICLPAPCLRACAPACARACRFEELGGFEIESNLGYFVAFAQRAFGEFAPKCGLWCTINEPEVYTEGARAAAGGRSRWPGSLTGSLTD
jgi:hypothetical protein